MSVSKKVVTRAGVIREGPAWKQRAVERSIQGAIERAGVRVQRFLDAAHSIIDERGGGTDFTVQEVVERSGQSLRSFYLQFDGKRDLLLALFDEALYRAADQIRAATDEETDPLDRLRIAVEQLFALAQPDPGAKRLLATEFAPELLISHPAEVKAAYAPLVALFVVLIEGAAEAGVLRADIVPGRTASLTIRIVLIIAQSSNEIDDFVDQSITADELWTMCSRGLLAGPTRGKRG